MPVITMQPVAPPSIAGATEWIIVFLVGFSLVYFTKKPTHDYKGRKIEY